MEAKNTMRLILRQVDGSSKVLSFEQGPIRIGRAANSDILLSSRGVSRQHAVLSIDGNGSWVVEDLDSANKTYVNGNAVRRTGIKSGDRLRIVDFEMEIDLEGETVEEQPSWGEETLVEETLALPLQETVVREPDAAHAPALRLPAKRLSDYVQISETICQADGIERLLLTVVAMAMKQFNAFHVWCALREQPSGPMMYNAGRRLDGQKVEFDQIQLHDKITQAVERHQSLVLPRVLTQGEAKERIRSAMIATVMRPGGCYGVIYIDNAMVHEHYSLSDLDYLMLVAIHTAAVLGQHLNS
ncbi:MAG: FHA domain-containing protein [Phycisphaerales bacterium]|nr:MAG: FHA domain-containing protein [Phycisphaerales bacterium]